MSLQSFLPMSLSWVLHLVSSHPMDCWGHLYRGLSETLQTFLLSSRNSIDCILFLPRKWCSWEFEMCRRVQRCLKKKAQRGCRVPVGRNQRQTVTIPTYPTYPAIANFKISPLGSRSTSSSPRDYALRKSRNRNRLKRRHRCSNSKRTLRSRSNSHHQLPLPHPQIRSRRRPCKPLPWLHC
jgi:hypothetical protein